MFEGLILNRGDMIDELPNWPALYRKLCLLGPVALKGLPREWIPVLQSYARTGDMFWSEGLLAALFDHWDDPDAAMEQVMKEFVKNVRREFREAPLCWSDSWRSLQGSDEVVPLNACVEYIDFRLTVRLRRALVRAARSRFVPGSRRVPTS